jgi:hypothetical protein
VLNYEPGPRSYFVTVTARDLAGGTVSRTFTITVRDVNERPYNLAISAAVVDENAATGTLIGTLSVSDDDIGVPVPTYTLTATAGGLVYLANSNQVRVGANINYETSPTFTFTASVSDNDLRGALTSSVDIVVTVRDNNELPYAINWNNSAIDVCRARVLPQVSCVHLCSNPLAAAVGMLCRRACLRVPSSPC